MDTKKKEELVKMIIENQQFLDSAEIIQQIWHDCTKKIILNLKDIIEITAEELGLKFKKVGDKDLGENETGIKLFKDDWTFHILFYFDGRHYLLAGLDRNENCSDETITKLIKTYHEYDGINLQHKGGWIVTSTLKEWNDYSWAEVQKNISVFIPEKIKAILNVLEQQFFNK